MYEGLRLGRSINPLGPCLGFRAVSTNGFATPYIYSTYTECVTRIDAFAAGLDYLQLLQRDPTDRMLVVRQPKGNHILEKMSPATPSIFDVY